PTPAPSALSRGRTAAVIVSPTTPPPARARVSMPLRRGGRRETAFERALDPGVERVEAMQRERPGRPEAALPRGVRPLVGEDAVGEGEAAGVVEARGRRALVEHPQPDLDVPEQPPLVREPDLGAERELTRPAEVVDDRGREQEVLVEAGVQRAGVDREGRDR